MIQDLSGSCTSKEPVNPHLVMESPVPLMHHDPDRSRITPKQRSLSLEVSISNEISHGDSRNPSPHVSFSVTRLDRLNLISLFKAKLCDLRRSLQNLFSTAIFNSHE